MSTVRPRRSLYRSTGIFALTFMVSIVVFAIAFTVNKSKAARPTKTYVSPLTTVPSYFLSSPPHVSYTPPYSSALSPRPTQPPFLEPELPLPPNGMIHNFTSREHVAPFEIRSTYGSNYFVKLVDVITSQPVLTVFVRGGSPTKIDVPVGDYIVKYASGDKWYGYQYLFGPQTAYSKTDDTFDFHYEGNEILGYTITLYKVQNGNLKTEPINGNDF